MRAPIVFSILKTSRRPSRLIIFISITCVFLKQGFAQGHESFSSIPLEKSSLSKKERVSQESERSNLQSFVVTLLKDYGCKDFEKKAFNAIVENLKNNPQPQMSYKDRHKAMISNLRIYNESDRPAGSFESSKKEFSYLLLELTRLTTETLFSYFVEENNGKVSPMSSRSVGILLKNENVTSIETPKKKILDLLKKLHYLTDDNHLDVGCQNEDKKNFLMLDMPTGYVSLNDIYRSQKFVRSEETRRELPIVSASSNFSAQADAAAPKPSEKFEVKVQSKTETKIEAKVANQAPVQVPIKEKVIEYSQTKIDKSSHREEPPKDTPETPKTSSQSSKTEKTQSEISADIVARYLSLNQKEVKPFLKKGWNNEYEDFISAFILNGHTKILRNFHKFEAVCNDISRYNTAQKKARFVAKFFKALAVVETNADPRIETTEYKTKRLRPKSKKFPRLSNIEYEPHSVGLFQLDENDYFNHDCQEIDYEKDVSIGYSKYRKRVTVDSYTGVHVEYLGDTRKSILNPFVNAACAVRILENKIPYGVISNNSYWAPLRPDQEHVSDRDKLIRQIKKEIPGC
jgi:hypothetical protein